MQLNVEVNTADWKSGTIKRGKLYKDKLYGKSRWERKDIGTDVNIILKQERFIKTANNTEEFIFVHC